MTGRITMLCPALLAAFLAACAQGEPPVRPAFYADLAKPGAVLDPLTSGQILNSYRISKGLAPLNADEKLGAIAQAEAIRLSGLGDIQPGRDAALDAALKAAGYAPARVKRSVTGGYHSFADAFSGWRGAPHHNAVLLAPKGRGYGLAAYAAPGSRHRVYWVMLVAE
jgi:uncharacterized protein YkwD